MPKLNDYRPQPELPPVRPPTLPPDFPDTPQNPSSELQPPSETSATPDKVAGTTPAPAEPETPEAMIKDEVRHKNARLREKINSVLEQHPELRDATDEIALKQGYSGAGRDSVPRTNTSQSPRPSASDNPTSPGP
jgi:outer membrane protein TolC